MFDRTNNFNKAYCTINGEYAKVYKSELDYLLNKKPQLKLFRAVMEIQKMMKKAVCFVCIDKRENQQTLPAVGSLYFG